MVAQRYRLIQEIRINCFDLHCPVEIEKGALIVDNFTSMVLLQLRLNILGIDPQTLSSVTLRINCFDDLGDVIPKFHPFFFTFKDIDNLGVHAFEEGTPIILDPRVRRVEVTIEKITFSNGNMWFPFTESIIPPQQKKIGDLEPDLRVQVNRDIYLLLTDENRDRILYIPRQLEDYWLCTCGRPNKNTKMECGRCGIDRKWIFRNLSETGIKRNLARYEETLNNLEEENRLFKERKQFHRIKWHHQSQRAILGVASLGIILALFFFVGNPYIKYARASALLQNEEFDKAAEIFGTLGGFKNSQEMVKETQYEKAFDRLESKRFDEAIFLFAGNPGYRNSDEMVKEVNYQKANSFLANKLFDESILIFATLQNYKDSDKMIHEVNYQKAADLLERNKFEAAAAVLSFTRQYKDSEKLFNKAYFLWGMQLLGRNQWEDAKNILSKVDKRMYPEVTALMDEAQKRIEKAKKEKKVKQ